MDDESGVDRWHLNIPGKVYRWDEAIKAYRWSGEYNAVNYPLSHRIPRRPWTGTPTNVFQEKPMYEPSNYEIREIGDALSYGERRPLIRLDVAGIESLPSALRRLAEIGYDLNASLAALQDACEKQRKRKALDEAVKAMTKAAE
jgi:hypothetical protein